MNKLSRIVLAGIFASSVVLTSCSPEEEPVAQTPQPVEEQAQTAPQAQTTPKTQTAPKVVAPAAAVPVKAGTIPAKTGTTPVAKAPVAPTATSNLPAEKKIVVKIQDAYAKLNDYTAIIGFFSKKNEKKVPNGNATLKGKFKYTFQKPRLEIFNVLEHSVSIAVGAKLVWRGDTMAKAKAGILSFNLPLTDSKLTTNRDWNFGQMDHVALLERLNSTKGKLSLAGASTVSGKECYMLKIVGPVADDDITEEIVAVDKKTFYMISDEIYVGEDKVFDLKIDIDGVNTNPPAADFEV